MYMEERRVTPQIQTKSIPYRPILVSLCLVAFALGSVSFPKVISGNFSSTDSSGQSSAGFSPASPLLPLSLQVGRSSDDSLWQFIDEASLAGSQKERTIIPQSYKTVRLNQDALVSLLRQAPMEFTDSANTGQLVMTVPMPDGTLARFRIEESPIMEPDLAAQFPDIKTYRGQGIDDPSATMRFDWTRLGFNAIVLSSQGTSFVEPYSQDDTTNYISYFNRDVSTDNLSLTCLLSETEIADAERRGISLSQAPDSSALVTGSTLRTYRLAVAATGEFTQQYGGGDVNTTLMKITTLINQVNAVYQREATITFQLVANETSIIFTDPATDGYTNDTPSTMLGENQTKLDAVIGPANYDIGHVFGGISVSPGFISFSGVASIGVACASGNKGRGVSTMGGASSSFPHSIFVSGVTHEIGHQFSAVHTFNSTTSGCSGQRSASGAYEPGSGSTIMAYSICGSDNLQSLPDLYFHTGSLEQIVSYAAGSGTCAAATMTGNSPPTISALSNFTIPANTPFVLSGSATDPNGDPLTYNWEEYDLGNASPPNTDDGTRPIFRSFPASTSAMRTFPSLQYILNNANVPPMSYTCGSSSCFTGELLPSTTRTMNFRFTAHDNRASGGGSANAAMQVSVVSAAGPFAVTQPNTAVTWVGGSNQTITWNVAGTTGAPISAASVNISLSTDGGNTFPIVLAASTPNDGNETVVVPSISTTMARIKIEAVGNIFFDISDTNFTITSAGVQVTVQTNPPGRFFTVDGTTYSTSQTFAWVPAFSHTISTTSPQNGGAGIQYAWTSWSDGGGMSHTVAPIANTTYTANFTTQYFLTMNSGTGGTVTPLSNWFNSGQTVVITASPSSGYSFNGWTGSGPGSFTGASNPANITMNGPISETAGFILNATARKTPFDFDGDAKTDTTIYRPSDGTWWILNSSNGTFNVQQWGLSGDKLVPGDYDGDGKTDEAIFRPSDGTWWILNSSTGNYRVQQWGFSSDIPVPGDYDGDGKTDTAIFRPSDRTWWILNSSTGTIRVQQWGLSGDIPVPGDYDGDGKTDIAIYRPSDGTW